MKLFATTMTPITAYSAAHILIVIGIILAAILSAYICKKLRVSSSIVLGVCGILLIIMEVFKQLLLTYVRGGSYSWSDFPFHLCSTPMYLCILFLLIRRLRDSIADFIMVYGFIGSVASFVVPYSSLYGYLFLTMQSFLWHGILFFLSVFLLIDRAPNRKSDYKSVGLIYIALALIAVILNIAFYNISAGTINMFFFGPGFPDMFILNTIYEKTHWIIETIAMIISSLFAGAIVYRVQFLLSKHFCQE